MDYNYYRTLIAVADDCPLRASKVPEGRGGKKSIAQIQYEMLAGHPYEYTQEDVLFHTWLERQDIPKSESDIAGLRAAFFSKPQACLRTSPLAKKYGWGLVFDEQGRIALCPMESAQYRDLLDGGKVKVVKAMRSKRA
ncbi:DUF6157 family protein [Paenibacillus cisolokensis]|uniref:DUF6157 family protein n=1 Tax=Paenibacillus cisolokensis TaxID=1658519 RepID=UPI003D2C8C79